MLTLVLGRGFLPLHSRKRLRNPAEKSLDIMPCFRRCLDKHDSELFCLLLRFFRSHLSAHAFISLLSNGTIGEAIRTVCLISPSCCLRVL